MSGVCYDEETRNSYFFLFIFWRKDMVMCLCISFFGFSFGTSNCELMDGFLLQVAPYIIFEF